MQAHPGSCAGSATGLALFALALLAAASPLLLVANDDSVCLGFAADPSHLVTGSRSFCVDWTDGILYSIASCPSRGRSRVEALDCAWHAARENLQKAVMQLVIISGKTAQDAVTLSEAKFWALQRILSRAETVAQSDPLICAENPRIVLRLGLSTSGLLALLAEGLHVGQNCNPFPTPTPLPAPATAKWLAKINHPTGLVIDAARLGPKPALCPQIYAQDGRLVYDQRFVHRLFFMQHRCCAYFSDLKAARKDRRVGINPIIVEALALRGPDLCDIVIGDDDAKRLIFLRTRLPFLSEGRVAIVTSTRRKARPKPWESKAAVPGSPVSSSGG